MHARRKGQFTHDGGEGYTDGEDGADGAGGGGIPPVASEQVLGE